MTEFIKNYSSYFIGLLIFISSSPILPDSVRVTLLITFILFFTKKINLSKFEIYIYTLTFFIFSYSLITDFIFIGIYGVNTYSFLYIPLCVLLGYKISKRFCMQVFLDGFERSMFIFSLISLFFYIALLLIPDIKDSFFKYKYYHTEHLTIGLYNYVSGWRNSGFASEPGLFQFFVAISMWWRERNYGFDKRVMLYIVTLVSTFSTSGFIILLIFFIINNKFKIFIFPLILLFSSQFLMVFENQIDNKLNGYAFESRFIPLKNSFNYISENLTGVGNIQYSNDLNKYNIGSFDSYSQISMRYGMQALILFIFLSFLLMKKAFFLSIIFMVTFTSQTIWYFPVVSCFYFYVIHNFYYERKVLC